MDFRRRDADERGTSEWVLFANDGEQTSISIVNLCDEGYGFVIYLDDDEWGAADTLAEAEAIARGIIG